jgi:hemoglobin
MKKQIEGLADVQFLVRTFYDKVLHDDTLSHYFAYVKENHWEAHLAIIDSFWNNMLFYTGGYDRNPLAIHKTLHFFKQLKATDFNRWLQLFNETVDQFFTGEKAELAKQRALSIATIMRVKVLEENSMRAASGTDGENTSEG